MKKFILQVISVIIISIGLVLMVRAYTDAPGTPPACPAGYPGCDASLNVGPTDQTKNAGLTLNDNDDALLTLNRQGAAFPANFRVGVDGALVINNNNSDIITLKNGNVGIGTAGPGQKLSVVGKAVITSTNEQSNSTALLQLSEAGVNPFMTFHQGGVVVNALGNINTDFVMNAASNIAFRTGYSWGQNINAVGTEHMRITSAGNIGIGTTGPGQKLDINGNARVGSAGAGYVYLGNRGYYIGDDLGGIDIQTNAPNFYVYDGAWKRLLREGDVIYATYAP